MSAADERYPFGPCVYCGVEVYDDDDELLPDIEHREDCPTNTGIYPILGPELGPLAHCPKCDHEWRLYGMQCMDCGVELKEGDKVARRWIRDDVAETVCLGCSILNPSDYQQEQAG